MIVFDQNTRLFTGDYIQTIKETAQKNKIALLDVESLSIDFANQHAMNWQNSLNND